MILATVVGLAGLAWSADRFVDGAAAVARYLGMPALLVGMLVIGFGTSAPELVVSVFAAAGGQPELAFGNALGSNIANIGLILGVTAVVTPVLVHRGILRKGLPVLLGVTVLLGVLTFHRHVRRADAVVLLLVLLALIVWSIAEVRRSTDDELGMEVEAEVTAHPPTRPPAHAQGGVGMAHCGPCPARRLIKGARVGSGGDREEPGMVGSGDRPHRRRTRHVRA